MAVTKKRKVHAKKAAAAEAKRLEIELRRERVLTLRVSGRSIRAIAKELEVSIGTIHSDLAAVFARTMASTNELQRIERGISLERLDKTINVAWSQAIKKPLEAIDRIVRIEQRRADLLGLDAPKVHIDLQQATKKLLDCVEQVCGNELAEKVLALFAEGGSAEEA